MKRTDVVTVGLLSLLACAAAAQAPEAGGKPAAPPDPIAEVVAAMRKAEAELKSVQIEMHTKGLLPSGLVVTSKGVLHVLRGTQSAAGAAVPAQLHTVLEVEFQGGLKSRTETAQTEDGIVMSQSDAVVGDLLLRFDRKVTADLEWAGEVLERTDLPGMKDRRASAPLGSTMVAELQRHFLLAVDPRPQRQGEAGVWLAGKRKPGLDADDPDLPVADRVELFVRTADHALLEVGMWQGETQLQQLVVDKLQLGAELPAKVFTVDSRGGKVRDVREFPPMWEQIEQVLKQAESKSQDGVVRPSKR